VLALNPSFFGTLPAVSMIGRFGLSSPTKDKEPSVSTATTSTTNSNIPSLSMNMNMNMNFMKKMSAGLSMPTIDPSSMMMTMNGSGGNGDHHKKSKSTVEQEEKKAMIAQTIAILEDLHLQSPANHSGMILAYTAKTMSPVLHTGVKFRWYRLLQSDGGGLVPVEESQKAWYAPSVDDIGCMICAQCEDTFDQGFSKYLEVSFRLPSYFVFPSFVTNFCCLWLMAVWTCASGPCPDHHGRISSHQWRV
jgi:hypothetical protein